MSPTFRLLMAATSHRVRLAAGAVVLVASIGLPQPAASTEPTFELMHLWAEEVEARALVAFSEPMKAQGVAWSEHLIRTNFEGIREAFAERLAHGVPPTASFWIGGGPLVDELIDQRILRPITLSGEGPSLAERLLPEVHAHVRHEKGLSVLPVGIHLQNFMVYNRAVLEAINEPIPTSWDEFIRVAEKAWRAGYSALSISDEIWQLRFLIGAIMAEHLDAQQLQALASRTELEQPQRQALRATFEVLGRLKPYINGDFRGLNWAGAVRHVQEGQAMANVLGDFITPLTVDRDDLVCSLPPGNQYVIWSLDAFVLTRLDEPGEAAAQQLFVKTVLDAEHVARYVSRKGGVPVLVDTDPELLPRCARVSLSAWHQSADRVSLTSGEWTSAMALIARFARDFLNDPFADHEATSDRLLNELSALLSMDAEMP